MVFPFKKRVVCPRALVPLGRASGRQLKGSRRLVFAGAGKGRRRRQNPKSVAKFDVSERALTQVSEMS
jgi:hypothetical protein